MAGNRVLAGVGGLKRLDGLEAPLIGRDAEARSGSCSTRRRSGGCRGWYWWARQAGVGKSRLGWEFDKYISGLAELVWWHRGRCLAYGEGAAFRALAEIVRQRLGIAEEARRGRRSQAG